MRIRRREFLGGLLASTFAPKSFSQSRKEVRINGKRIKTVDIHAHASINEVERVIAGTPVDRRIRGSRLLEPSRLDMMDAWGIDVSVISANQYWWYAAEDRMCPERSQKWRWQLAHYRWSGGPCSIARSSD